MGELGIFYPSIQSRGINTVTAGLDPHDVVDAVHLRNIIEAIEMEGQGDKKFTKLTPVATFLAEQE